jgi:hypothetical protein
VLRLLVGALRNDLHGGFVTLPHTIAKRAVSLACDLGLRVHAEAAVSEEGEAMVIV